MLSLEDNREEAQKSLDRGRVIIKVAFLENRPRRSTGNIGSKISRGEIT